MISGFFEPNISSLYKFIRPRCIVRQRISARGTYWRRRYVWQPLLVWRAKGIVCVLIHVASENVGFYICNVFHHAISICGSGQPRQVRPVAEAVSVWKCHAGGINSDGLRATQPTRVSKAGVAKWIAIGFAIYKKTLTRHG